MTEKLEQPLSTQIVIPSQTASSAPILFSTVDVPHKVEVVEEEPYTIRCICGYSGDDGNTIYCETCDTWQHIDCYYPDSRAEALREDFAHSCVVCKPRPLQKQRAIQRTQRLQGDPIAVEVLDRKTAKRPPSKSHKKKPKPTDMSINGAHPGHENSKNASPNDQPHPPKKAKHSHKPSQSGASQAQTKKSPPYGAWRVNGTTQGHTQHSHHPPSPANTPPDLPSDFEIHNYSDAFRSLYSDGDVKIVETNSFAKINVLDVMSQWLRDPDKMRSDTGHMYDEVFRPMPADIDAKRPQIRVEDKKTPFASSDTVLHWKNLTTPAAIEKNIALIELNGQIGIQKEYCDDPANMWSDLSSPLPFVFFHPDIPLYIDTRKEGSQARHVRRSCKPNATLETFISGGSEYHFWLVSDRYVAAGEQIALPWDFRFPKNQKDRMLQLIDLGDEETKGHDDPDLDEHEYQALTNWVYRILSEYGGCACELGNNCAFARFHRRYQGRVLARAAHAKKKSRKPKQNNISPTSTGQATNSRAPSEGHMDDGPDDAKSTAGSSHSKPPSRDRTPAPRQGSFDTEYTGILTGPTGRDKRKVAMLEDQFRAMEQPKPKKKRVSDGTTTSSSSKSKPRISTANEQTIVANGSGHYVDAGTSGSKSCSPSSAVSPSAQTGFKQSGSRQGSVGTPRQLSLHPRPQYVDACVQTEPTEGTWYGECAKTPTKPRRIISLSQRLLNSRHKIRAEVADRRRSQSSALADDGTTPMDVDSSTIEVKSVLGSPIDVERKPSLTSPGLPTNGVDVTMTDAPSISPTSLKPPVTFAPPIPAVTSPVKKSPELRVQMPPVPVFGNSVSGTPGGTTPVSAAGSMVQSPFSANNMQSPFTPSGVNGTPAAHQSPVRKKLSLSDYKKSKLDKSAAGKSVPSLLKASSSNLDESKPVLDQIMDSPTGEKNAENVAMGTNGSTTVATT